MFALVDVNNMYVSCERVFDPKLAHIGVIILSNNDGCAVARSQQAKDAGIKMGEPWFKIKDLAKQHGIVALSSNYALYGDMSDRIMTVLRAYSPAVEVYSIDECFINLQGLDGMWPSHTVMGQSMRQRVRQWTGLPVCVGIGPSKTLAKLANHIGKKRPEFAGVCDLMTMPAQQVSTLFNTIGVGEVWGVGRRISQALQAGGITTVGQLRDAPLSWLRSKFGVVMERTGKELRGESCLALEEVAPVKKQIVSSRSFGQMVLTFDELRESVATYMTRAAEKMRHQNSVCEAIQIFVETNRFRLNDPQYSNSITIPLPNPSSDTMFLVRAATFGLQSIYRAGYSYKKAGVILVGLTDALKPQQQSFLPIFGAGLRSDKMMLALDEVNRRFGADTLTIAAAGIKPSWSMRRASKTPNYTTRWEELPIAQ